MRLSLALACLGVTSLLTSLRGDDAKPAIVLPKDAKAIVISYDPGAGGFIRKGEAPYLKIQADGQVTVTNLHNGMKKEGKLTVKELEDLLKFIVDENDFFAVDKAKIDAGIQQAAQNNGTRIAVGGAGTSVIAINVNDKKHEVNFRAASTFSKTYPQVKMLGQYAAIEKKLSELAIGIEKEKAK